MKNTGTSTAPVFTQRTGNDNPFNAVDTYGHASPELVDLDNDGDLDAVIGRESGQIEYWRNVGNANSPSFQMQSGTDNPFNGQDVGDRASPTLADVDGDGDLDALIGNLGGTLRFLRNDGNAANPDMTAVIPDGYGGGTHIFDHIQVNNRATPTLIDWDKDGDVDLFTTEGSLGVFQFHENVGTASAGVLEEQSGDLNPFDAHPGYLYHVDVTFADFDGDGDLEAMAGDSGGIVFMEPVPFALIPGKLETPPAAHNPFDLFDNCSGCEERLLFIDIDNDGDLDLIRTDYQSLALLENTGTATAGVWVERLGAANPFNGLPHAQGDVPAAGDLDDDDDPDVIMGRADGTFLFFQNTGTPTAPAFTQQTGAANPLDGVDVGDFAHPSLGDLDDDGDLDALVGRGDGGFSFFENTGNAGTPIFSERSGNDHPLDGVDVGASSAPLLVDTDLDGDLDAFIASTGITDPLGWYENRGTRPRPTFSSDGAASTPCGAETPTAPRSWPWAM